MLLRAMETHVSPTKDRAWAEAALSFLRAHVTIGAPGLLGGLSAEADEREYISRVVQGLRDASSELEMGATASLFRLKNADSVRRCHNV